MVIKNENLWVGTSSILHLRKVPHRPETVPVITLSVFLLGFFIVTSPNMPEQLPK